MQLEELKCGLVVAERFRLERELRRGGMGSVWLAQHVALEIPCAVKFILDARLDNDIGRARFALEARAAAKLRSPHVVQIFDHGIWQTTPYIAMELLEGESLADRLTRKGRISLDDTSKIVEQVAQALMRAHQMGLVHRDLKPDNIFIVSTMDPEIVKVLDFGIARVSEAVDPNTPKTATGVLLGTPSYMSPEQFYASREVDHRSDLWSLAVIVFECITGERPFMGAGFGELYQAISADPLPVPSKVAQDTPAAFDGWLNRRKARAPRLFAR